MKAYEAWPRFRAGEGSVEGWLYRITYRVCLDRLRSQRRHPTIPHETTARSATACDPADSIVNRLSVERVLSRLDPEYRAALVLVDALGVDYATAARILDIPRGTLASRLHTARAAVREALKE